MRKYKKLLGLLLAPIYLFFWENHSQAAIQPVPYVAQSQTNWCWAATSEGILGYFGNTVTQCQIADWALSRSYCCTTAPPPCNATNTIYGTGTSIRGILQNWGVNSTGSSTTLTPATIVTEMAGGRPFVIRWGWTGGGGHFLTARGFVGSNTNGIVFLYDPWNGERMVNYLGTVSSPAHTWTHTLRLTGVSMPSADINVNGNDGQNFSATSTTSLNVNISLNPNGHTNAADFWVAYDIGGTRFYFDSWGDLTTIPTPWRQGPLTTINESVYSDTLPIGTYYMYFAVDLTQDGVLDDVVDLYWDTIKLTVNDDD